jgi:hypothetical protein
MSMANVGIILAIIVKLNKRGTKLKKTQKLDLLIR